MTEVDDEIKLSWKVSRRRKIGIGPRGRGPDPLAEKKKTLDEREPERYF